MLQKFVRLKYRLKRKTRFKLGFNTRLVNKNQNLIKDALKEEGRIFLHPVPAPGCSGHVEHYFHFLFDLLLPLSCIVRDFDGVYTIKLFHIGVLSELLIELFGSKIEFVSRREHVKGISQQKLVGMTPTCVPMSLAQTYAFKSHIFSILNLTKNANPKKILSIERMPPRDYFVNDAIIKGAGSSRRSIINHEEMSDKISSMINAEYTFVNVRLEELSFLDQVKLFKDAAVIVAQHGAALGNMIWMNEGSIIIEVGINGKQLFEKIAKLNNHRYLLYDSDQLHVNVNIGDLERWILNQNELSPFLNKPI